MTLRMPRANRRAFSAVAASSGTSLAAAVVAFIVNILMARHLGPESRGEVAWALQGAYVIAPLLALGVDRQAPREPNRARIAAAAEASLAIERGTGMPTGSLGRYGTFQITIWLAQKRLSLQESIAAGGSSGNAGLESLTSPIGTLAQLLETQARSQAPFAWGFNFLSEPLLIVPDRLQPAKQRTRP